MHAFSRLVLRHAAAILIAALLLTVGAGYCSVRLFKNLKLDLEELLPTSARSVRDLGEVRRRLPSIDTFAVLVFSGHPEASRRFVDDLARRLEQAPPDLIAGVEYRIDRELEFFRRRRALYLDLPDLLRIRNYVRDRISYEADLHNPLNIFSGAEAKMPRLEPGTIQGRYDRKVSEYTRFPDGYYATPDQKIRVILVHKAGRANQTTSLLRLRDLVTREIDTLSPRRYAPDLEVHYSGDVENSIEEQAAIFADLELSTVIVVLLVTAALVLFYRSVRTTLALLASLFMGTLWTFGVAYFLIGFLNANTAFLGSIIAGNGINFGIILAARYLEERRRNLTPPLAAELAMVRSAAATWIAALAAAFSYGSLIVTQFRGFRQFGIIGLIGMIICWLTAYTVLPCLLSLGERPAPKSVPPPPKARPGRTRRRFFDLLSGLERRGAPWIVAVTVLLTVAALAQLPRLSPDILEADLTRIRSRESLESGSGYYSRYLDRIFQRYLSPVVILPRSRRDAREIATRLRERQQTEGARSMIASVQTLDDFVPRDQVAKLRILSEIQAYLSPRIVARSLSARDRRLVREFLTPEATRRVRERDLPPLVVRTFKENDGHVGRLVVIEPPMGPEIYVRENLFRLVRELRSTADQVAPGTPVAGTFPVTVDMLESISRDGSRATLLAFASVFVLVILLFRSVKSAGAVLASLLLGVSWLLGLLLGFGMRINFLNFIALPITFGIGVDYGVNIIQRYRQEGPGAILMVIRRTGPAVALCSLTTSIGYSSLLFARNQAFFSFGRLAVLGELTCVTAALLSVPAFIHFRDQWRERRRAAREAASAGNDRRSA